MRNHHRLYLAGRLAFALALVITAGAAPAFAQYGKLAPPDLAVGERIYKAGCISCHGADGKGTPTEISGFEKPETFPDFTRCDQTTAETDLAYKAVVVHG